MQFLITGHTGLVGSFLIQHLEQQGHQCIRLGRCTRSDIQWGKLNEAQDKLLQIDHIIHLAGANILSKRWSQSYKKQLVSSRVNTLEELYQFYATHFDHNLKSVVCTSAIGYYATSRTSEAIESEHVDSHFVAQICNKIEEKAHHFLNLGIRTNVFRLGVVISNKGGMLSQLTPSFKKGLGSSIGSGEQLISWVSEYDVIKAYTYVTLGNETIQGTFNLVGGNVAYKHFVAELAKSLGKKIWIPMVPSFIIRIVMGQRSKLLLEGRPISNQKFKDEGFQFRHESIELAIYDAQNQEF